MAGSTSPLSFLRTVVAGGWVFPRHITCSSTAETREAPSQAGALSGWSRCLGFELYFLLFISNGLSRIISNGLNSTSYQSRPWEHVWNFITYSSLIWEISFSSAEQSSPHHLSNQHCIIKQMNQLLIFKINNISTSGWEVGHLKLNKVKRHIFYKRELQGSESKLMQPSKEGTSYYQGDLSSMVLEDFVRVNFKVRHHFITIIRNLVKNWIIHVMLQ